MLIYDYPMTSMASMFAESIATLTRSLPQLRGLGRIYLGCNHYLLMAGADPIVCARMKDGTNIIVDLRSRTEVHAFYRGVYDPLLLRSIQALLDPDDLFMDVGANIGFYTVAIAAFLRSRRGAGMVVAFEPLQANCNRLMKNLRINQLDHLVCTFQLGLSSCTDQLQIVLREDFQNGSITGNASISTGDIDFDGGFHGDVISVKPLDAIWPELSDSVSPRNLAFVKIDIEGHEDLCLEGARTTLATERPYVLMEVNKPYYRARGVELVKRFRPPVIPTGYRIYHFQSRSWMPINSLEPCAELDNVFLVPVEKCRFLEGCMASIR